MKSRLEMDEKEWLLIIADNSSDIASVMNNMLFKVFVKFTEWLTIASECNHLVRILKHAVRNES